MAKSFGRKYGFDSVKSSPAPAPSAPPTTYSEQAPAPEPVPYYESEPAPATPTTSSGIAAPEPSSLEARNPPTREELKAEFPHYAYAIETSAEVEDVFRRAFMAWKHDGEPWSESKFQAEIEKTHWWRTTSHSQRVYLNKQHTDPATFQSDLSEVNRQIRTIADQAGYRDGIVNDQHFDWLANQAMRLGLTGQALQQFVIDNLASVLPGIPNSDELDELKRIAADYEIPLNLDAERYWTHGIQTGRLSVDDFRGYMARAAKEMFPSLAKDLDSGMTLRQITAPYRTQIADLMEIDPGTIDFTHDARWRNVIAYVDPKDGSTRKMSAVEMAKYVREQPEWRKTRNALDSAAEIGERLLQSFGAVSR